MKKAALLLTVLGLLLIYTSTHISAGSTVNNKKKRPTVTPTPSATSTPTPTPGLTLKVISPNGGETLSAGQLHTITWESSSQIDKVSIGYKACPSCLSWISYNIPNTYSYDWTVQVGNTTNTQFQIYIIGYHTGYGSVTDTSDASFTVIQPSPTPTATPVPSFQLESLSSHSGPTQSVIRLSGKGFGVTPGSVIFTSATDSRYGAVISAWSDQSIEAQVPGMLTSNQQTRVSVKSPAGQESNSLNYYITAGQPVISSISPQEAKSGESITINGTDFGDSTGTVLFYDNATVVASLSNSTWSPSSITVQLPSTLTNGQEYAVQVKTASGPESSVKFYVLGQ